MIYHAEWRCIPPRPAPWILRLAARWCGWPVPTRQEQWQLTFTPQLDIPARSKVELNLSPPPPLGGPWAFDVEIDPRALEADE